MTKAVIASMIQPLIIVILFMVNTIWGRWRGKVPSTSIYVLLSRTGVFVGISITLLIAASCLTFNECYWGTQRGDFLVTVLGGIGSVFLLVGGPLWTAAAVLMVIGILLGHGIWTLIERLR